ncbi:hypothetical protein Avbf_00607 [Armadillidium vulgare]|nr:hypothetical protein Avbf_00607 [Armadillidium vulgare]
MASVAPLMDFDNKCSKFWNVACWTDNKRNVLWNDFDFSDDVCWRIASPHIRGTLGSSIFLLSQNSA